MTDTLHELFESVGRDLTKYLDLVRLPFNYRIRFGDGSSLDVSGDEAAMRERLEAMEPGAGAQFKRFLQDAGVKYQISRGRFTDRNFRHWHEFFTPANLYYVWRLNVLTRLNRFAARYFKDPRIQLALTFQAMYLGLAPSDAPAIYSLLTYTECNCSISRGSRKIPAASCTTCGGQQLPSGHW